MPKMKIINNTNNKLNNDRANKNKMMITLWITLVMNL